MLAATSLSNDHVTVTVGRLTSFLQWVKRRGLFEASPDGCSLGGAYDGGKIYKPWKGVTSHAGLRDALDQLSVIVRRVLMLNGLVVLGFPKLLIIPNR